MITTEYTIPAGIRCSIGLVTDLHETEPTQLLELLRQAKPDMIAICGDTLERHSEGSDPRDLHEFGRLHRMMRSAALRFNAMLPGRQKQDRMMGTRRVYRFLTEAVQIAPVFMSRGNHEWYMLPEDREMLAKLGVTLLENEDCQWNGMRIGGLSPATDLQWLDEFSKKPGFKLLLCHHPEYYPKFLKGKNIDLILAGHAHGGQIRIGNQGVFSSGQGILPRYTKGVYHNKMVVSTGCANTAGFPRWGNPCELVLVHLR